MMNTPLSKNTSSLEFKMIMLLEKENIVYEREKVFKDLYNGLYRFDFYIPSIDSIIECHGAQHYQYIPAFYKTRSDFLKAQERDRRKIAYCLAHKIKIYCIPYWEIDGLHTWSDVLQEKFLAKTKFHNDEVLRQQKR